MFPWQGVQHCTKQDNKCQNHFHAMGVSSSCFQVGCFLMLWTSMLNFMTSLVQMLVWEMFGKANRTFWKMSWQKDPLKLFNLGLFAFQQILVGLSPQCCHCVCVETACFCCFFDSYGYFLCRCGSISMHKHAIVGWRSVCQLFLLPRCSVLTPKGAKLNGQPVAEPLGLEDIWVVETPEELGRSEIDHIYISCISDNSSHSSYSSWKNVSFDTFPLIFFPTQVPSTTELETQSTNTKNTIGNTIGNMTFSSFSQWTLRSPWSP